MTRFQYWKWRVSLAGISAFLVVIGLICLSDRLRASAVSAIANVAQSFEAELTSALSSAFALSQPKIDRDIHASSDGHTPHSSESTSSPMAVDFDLAYPFTKDSFS